MRPCLSAFTVRVFWGEGCLPQNNLKATCFRKVLGGLRGVLGGLRGPLIRALKSGNIPFDHLQELQEHLQELQEHLQELQEQLQDLQEHLQALQEHLQDHHQLRLVVILLWFWWSWGWMVLVVLGGSTLSFLMSRFLINKQVAV